MVLDIGYEVMDDPQTVSIVREFIKTQLPLPASLNRTDEEVIDWLKTDIAVIKVVVKLTNNGNKPTYYVTNAFCGVVFQKIKEDYKFKPIAWSVKNPIGLPKIYAEKGHVLQLPMGCTLDLAYVKVLPGTSVSKEYYYIVTKPFKGIIEDTVEICSEPLSNKCVTIERTVYINIADDN